MLHLASGRCMTHACGVSLYSVGDLHLGVLVHRLPVHKRMLPVQSGRAMKGRAAHSCPVRGVLGTAGSLAACVALLSAALPAVYGSIQTILQGAYLNVSPHLQSASPSAPEPTAMPMTYKVSS